MAQVVNDGKTANPNVLNLKEITHGLLFLTFDDHDVVGWRKAIPFFAQNNVRATFSLSGVIDKEALECMKVLRESGHTVGLHTLHHADAPEYIKTKGGAAYMKDEVKPQLDVCKKAGLAISTFAFPNNKYDDASLELLSGKFCHFRVGCGLPRGSAVANFDKAFTPIAEFEGEKFFRGFGVGEYYSSRLDDLEAVLDRLAKNNEVATLYSHGIASCAKGVNMPLELLVPLVSHARSLGIVMAGLDDVPW